MLVDETQIPQYQEALDFLDSKFGLCQLLRAQYKDKNFRPRVHAELIILEKFYDGQLEFVDRDRYIGCSKPACYCCYYYICAHPGNFVRPACHNNIYLNWRPPDIGDDPAGWRLKRRKEVLNDLLKKIRWDALEHIRTRRGRSYWQPDSTTGITASVGLLDLSLSDGLDPELEVMPQE
jgi:hypothetical protein